MYFEKDLIESKFMCPSCKKKFEEPLLLPCGESICKNCINAIIDSNELKCPFCANVHEKPEKGFPIQKLLLEIIKIKPIRIYRGGLYNQAEKLLADIETYTKDFIFVISNLDFKISNYCSEIREQIRIKHVNPGNVDDEIWEESTNIMLRQVDQVEEKWRQNLDLYRDHLNIEFFRTFITDADKQREEYSKFMRRAELTEELLQEIFDSSQIIYDRLQNYRKYFRSFVCCGAMPVLRLNSRNIYELKYEYYDCNDILDIQRLEHAQRNLSSIDYKGLLLNNCNRNIIQCVYMSLFTNENIAFCFYNYDMIASKYEIVVKLVNNQGSLVKEASLHHPNSELIAMSTGNNFIIIAVKSLTSNQNELYLYDSSLNYCQSAHIDYPPRQITTSTSSIFLLRKKSPLVQRFNYDLQLQNEFGQDYDQQSPFCIPNVTQIIVKDEKLYVRDTENSLLNIYSTKNGDLIRSLHVNLNDCLFYVDTFLRLVAVNTRLKSLSIYNENGELLFTYDLSIVKTISSFCIASSGRLLICDKIHKLLFIF